MTHRMNVVIALLFCLSLSACSKEKKPDETPVEQSTSVDEETAPEATGTKKAEGDEREMLLALQRVHFAVDKDTLSDESRTALNEAATRLKKLPKVHLYVDGHADETGTTEYNLQLGGKRANAVRTYLERSGIEADRLHVVSFGEEQPLAEGSDSDSLAKNRRVDFRVMRGDIELVLEESPLQK